MTEQQRKFCISYVRSRNAYKAAQDAGYSLSYSKSRAYELLKIKEIATEVKRLEDIYFKQGFKDLAIKGLHAISEIIDNVENPTARLRAAELVLKQAGFIDPTKVDQEFTIRVKLPKELEDGS